MKLSIEKVYSLAARHPEINALLQEHGASTGEVLKLRGHLTAWRVTAVALLFAVIGVMIQGELALDAQKTLTDNQASKALEQAELLVKEKQFSAYWSDRSNEWEGKAQRARKDLKAVAKLAEECARENPKWGINRP